MEGACEESEWEMPRSDWVQLEVAGGVILECCLGTWEVGFLKGPPAGLHNFRFRKGAEPLIRAGYVLTTRALTSCRGSEITTRLAALTNAQAPLRRCKVAFQYRKPIWCANDDASGFEYDIDTMCFSTIKIWDDHARFNSFSLFSAGEVQPILSVSGVTSCGERWLLILRFFRHIGSKRMLRINSLAYVLTANPFVKMEVGVEKGCIHYVNLLPRRFQYFVVASLVMGWAPTRLTARTFCDKPCRSIREFLWRHIEKNQEAPAVL
ncbi:hypothetical protein SODALDRAFT_355025 [Sodiomyces alkalinus F11]|uniref:Uncharacterized protein n=1 Tax=Sodiomyces alkalinus (strain CBS 110278 / VKM F-3762 / F11) TaxID=1314773 RepID=A0A3N2Q874_SODAK|nr:hypothetical protein SODALDRAFT_355025 [Sodiomyces alkalinus F11]ROT42835.1 hypothetical protein SODALDRAFT_355025 [Sodiomyces alkalinus F11]